MRFRLALKKASLSIATLLVPSAGYASAIGGAGGAAKIPATRPRLALKIAGLSIATILLPVAADASAVAGGAASILGPLALWVTAQNAGIETLLIAGCVLGCIGTFFTLLFEGLKITLLLGTFFALAVGTGFVLAAPLMVTAIAALFGAGALV